jgi:hypothetical protein
MNTIRRGILAAFWLAIFTATAARGAVPVVLILGPDNVPAAGSPLQTALAAQPCKAITATIATMPALDGVDAIVLSDRLARDVTFRAELFARNAVFQKFFENGGVLLDCAAAAPENYWLHFYPVENSMKLVPDEMAELQVLHPEHPLGRKLQQAMGPLDGSRLVKFSTPVALGAFYRQRGFRVVAANDALGMYALLLETAVGRGRAYLCTIPLDRPQVGEDEAAQAGMQRLATGFAAGLLATLEQIKENRLPAFQMDTGADQRTPFSWRIIVLPDTQCYVDIHKAANEHHYHNQIRWITENIESGDIRYVLHLGDITQHNSAVEWVKARAIMAELNGKVPYLMIPGNHDIGTTSGGANDRSTLMGAYFSLQDAKKNSKLAGAFQEEDPTNVYHIFKAGGGRLVDIGIGIRPRDEVMRWARKIVEQHPRHRLILVTHAYLYDDDTRFDFKLKGITQAGNPQYYGIMGQPGYANDGEQMWRGIVSKVKAPSLVVCGHVLGDGLGYLMSSSDSGKKVAQMLVNFQNRKEGGGGYLRILEFSKDSSQLRVMDYSPSADRFMPGSQSLFKVDFQ